MFYQCIHIIFIPLLIFIIFDDKHIHCNSCILQSDIELFHCSHKGLTTLPGFIHENTIELDLSYNLIEILHEDTFTRLYNIRKLILANNKIYKITERAFIPIAKTLIWLDLRFNQLTSNYYNPFPVTAFSQLIHVSYLDLSGNALSLLPAKFLYAMGSSLNRLEMSLLPNKIYTEPDTFNGLSRLHHLNLAHNTFVNLMEDALHGLRPEHFSYLNLDGVKWICDCQILWFRRWLNRLPKKALYINSKPGGVCDSPPQYQNIALMYLNLTSLQCEPELMHTIPSVPNITNNNNIKMNHTDSVTTPIHVYGIHGENLTLVCSFISEPKMQIQWFYNGVLIQPHWSRFIQTVSPGVKFTTTLYFKQLDKTTDEGYYKCQASNHKGYASATFYVHVQKSIVKDEPLQLLNKNSIVKLDSNSLFNSINVIIFIVLFNIIFIIIGLFIMKCVYQRRVSFKNHKIINSNNELTVNIEPHNVTYEKSITSTTNMNNDNSQSVTQLTKNSLGNNINIINSNNNKCTDYIPMSKLHNETVVNAQMNDTIHEMDDKLPNRQKYNTTELLKDNHKSILQTKLLNYSMKYETPSPQSSSDMGYLTSNASQNCEDSIDYTLNNNDCITLINQSKPKTYYTLNVKSTNHSPELIYTLNNKNENHCLTKQNYSLSNNSLSLKQIFNSSNPYSLYQHSNKYQYVSQSSNIKSDKSFNLNSCPIHGLINKHENLNNSIENSTNTDCPIHGNAWKRINKCDKFKQNSNKYSSYKLNNLKHNSLLDSLNMNSFNEI